MKKVCWILFLVLAGAWLFTAPNRVWAKGGTPATASFREYQISGVTSYTDMIRSDVNSPYQNNQDCVTSAVSGSLYFLRTVQPNCVPTTARTLVLDFSEHAPSQNCIPLSDPDTTVALDPCGPNTGIPDVRFSASTLFKSRGTSTPLTLFINLATNFHENDFELVFESPVCFTVENGSRVMDTGVTCPGNPAGDDLADLYQISETTGQPTFIGTYHIPFQVTVTEQ